MDRLGIRKSIEGDCEKVILFKEGNLLQLYRDMNGDITIVSNTDCFIIDKSNYQLYQVFTEMYHNFMNKNTIKQYVLFSKAYYLLTSNEFKSDDVSSTAVFKRVLLEKEKYNAMVSKGIIDIRSDDFINGATSSITVEKTKNKYKLRFSDKSDNKRNYIVKVTKENSQNITFNDDFQELFNNLYGDDIDYNQIHIGEYLYQKKLAKARRI